jgi:hypothetical protein
MKMIAHMRAIASMKNLRYFGSLGRVANKLASNSFPIGVVVFDEFDETRVTSESVSRDSADLVSVDDARRWSESEIDGKLNAEYALDRPLSRSIRSPADRRVPYDGPEEVDPSIILILSVGDSRITGKDPKSGSKVEAVPSGD